MPTETSPADLAAAKRGFVIAPAGFGKTELISRAVAQCEGRSLILTHTHAGVNALRSRLASRGVPRSRYDVSTIAGWGLRWSAAYPTLSEIPTDTPSGQDWEQVYEATGRLLERRVAIDLLQRSYSGVFVDEYQDCNLAQHAIVMAIAEHLPCRLLGDPMQGIFAFSGNHTIDWQNDVQGSFDRLPDLVTPHRWRNTNPELGQWIVQLRELLLTGSRVDLQGGPLEWKPLKPNGRYTACIDAAASGGSVVAIAKWPSASHEIARELEGTYGSMEEMDCNALMQFCQDLDSTSDGFVWVTKLLDFANKCFANMPPSLNSWTEAYRQRACPASSGLTARDERLVGALNSLATDRTVPLLLQAALEIDRYKGAKLFRRELWGELRATLSTYDETSHETVKDAAWNMRERTRQVGRRPEDRTVSRTLLIKGLEFDHAVVLDAAPRHRGDTEHMNAKEAYVAMTRGTKRLTVVSENPVVQYPTPTNII